VSNEEEPGAPEARPLPSSSASAPAVGLAGIDDAALATMAADHQALVVRGNLLMGLPVVAVAAYAIGVYRGVIAVEAIELAALVMVMPLALITAAFAWLRSRFMRSLIDRGLDAATAKEALRQMEIGASRARFVSGSKRRAERVTAHLLKEAGRARPDS
jgi:hypothetical protein